MELVTSPDEELRLKSGWLGRGISEGRDPEMVRACEGPAAPIVLVRFMAEFGCGIPELKPSPPRVWRWLNQLFLISHISEQGS